MYKLAIYSSAFQRYHYNKGSGKYKMTKCTATPPIIQFSCYEFDYDYCKQMQQPGSNITTRDMPNIYARVPTGHERIYFVIS